MLVASNNLLLKVIHKMVVKNQTYKYSFALLFLSILSLLLSLSSLVYIIAIKLSILDQSNDNLCNDYLIQKYNDKMNIFIKLVLGHAITFVVCVIICLFLIFKKQKRQDLACNQLQFKSNVHQVLYVLFSLGILGCLNPFGLCLSIVVQQEKSCYGYIEAKYLINVLLAGVNLALLIGCWLVNWKIYLSLEDQIAQTQINQTISFGGEHPTYFNSMVRQQGNNQSIISSLKYDQKQQGNKKSMKQIQGEAIKIKRSAILTLNQSSSSDSKAKLSHQYKYSKKECKTQKQHQKVKADSLRQEANRQNDGQLFCLADQNNFGDKQNINYVEINKFHKDNSLNYSRQRINNSISKHNTFLSQFQNNLSYRQKLDNSIFKNQESRINMSKIQFGFQNPYNKFIKEDEQKKQQLQMLIYSKTIEKINLNSSLVYEKKRPINKTLFEQENREKQTDKPSFYKPKQNNLPNKFQTQIINTLREKFINEQQ